MFTSKLPEAGLVERMARTLAATGGNEADWQDHTATAELLLREIRLPSRDMLETARQCVPARVDVTGVWELMIDLALLEGEEPEPLRAVGT